MALSSWWTKCESQPRRLSMSRRDVVRVVIDDETAEWFDNPIIDCLRYAGLIRVHDTRTPAGHQVFDVLPPKDSGAEWAVMNADRMRSFGFNAVPAPPA